MPMFFLSALLGASPLIPSLIPAARADEEAAETCLRTKIWDGYKDGWAVRSATKTSLGEGEHRVYLVTLYAGNTYHVLACGDSEVANIDVVVYDSKGNKVLNDVSFDREPVVEYTPTTTDTFYVAVYASKLNAAGKQAGVATALTYK